MDIFIQIAKKIIREQELIIGPVAWLEAKKVTGLTVDESKKEVTFSGDPRVTIDALVAQYEKLFGIASKNVCRDSVLQLTRTLPTGQIPSSLI